MDDQIRDTMQAEPGPYRAFIGTLFLFIFVANWSTLIPGVLPPTARLETDLGLALLVFVAVIGFGIRSGGIGGYLSTFASPSPLMIPLNFIESITRTFSMFVRLFGNVMSGVFVIGIVFSLAGLLVPIPLMALDLLTGAVQAYILPRPDAGVDVVRAPFGDLGCYRLFDDERWLIASDAGVLRLVANTPFSLEWPEVANCLGRGDPRSREGRR